MSGSKVKIALVGMCGYGAKYLRALLDAAARGPSCGFDLAGLVDPNASASPWLTEVQERGIPVFADMEGLFSQGQIDLVMLATPIHLHASQTILSLSYGCNVLCEKPLAATVEQALDVEAALRRYGRFVAVGFQWSFSKAVQALKRDIQAGDLGKPIRLRTLAIFPRARSYFRRNDWAGRIATNSGQSVFDSPLNNATAHYLHNMLYLLGATRETSAMPQWLQAEMYRANDIENFDTAAVRCGMADGAEILFYTTHALPNRMGPICRFEFERAVVEYDFTRDAQFVARFGDGTVRNYGPPDADRTQKIWQSIDAARGGQPVACPAAAAFPHVKCVAAARESCPGICEFPEWLQRRGMVGGEEMTWIDGLDDTLLTCYERGVLPCDLGASWATAGRRVQLDAAHAATLIESR
jgi:predicted dehydrogenase